MYIKATCLKFSTQFSSYVVVCNTKMRRATCHPSIGHPGCTLVHLLFYCHMSAHDGGIDICGTQKCFILLEISVSRQGMNQGTAVVHSLLRFLGFLSYVLKNLLVLIKPEFVFLPQKFK